MRWFKMYCKNCGKKIDDNTELCSECRTGTPSPKIPSKLWYLLPLFLGIIGGLLGYFILKDRDKSMAKNILIFGAIWMVVILIMPYDNKSNNNTQTISANVPTQKEIVTQISQNGDKEFISWTISSSRTVSSDLENAADAAKRYDLTSLEIYGRVLKEDSKKYLYEIKTFKVSTQFQRVLDEYQNALEDLQSAGEYTETGAKNVNTGDLKLATLYINKGEEHMTTATSYLK